MHGKKRESYSYQRFDCCFALQWNGLGPRVGHHKKKLQLPGLGPGPGSLVDLSRPCLVGWQSERWLLLRQITCAALAIRV